MKHEFAYEEAQRHLAQRNRFAALAAMLGLTSLVAIGAAATREESVILVPVTAERLTLTSGAVEAHYLELVTRDTALMLLNRAPESLDYWMEQVLKLADPAAHGHLKAELDKSRLRELLQFASCRDTNVGVRTEREKLLFSPEAILQAPKLRTISLNQQVQSLPVRQLVGSIGGFRLFDLNLAQGHWGYRSFSVPPENTPKIPPRQIRLQANTSGRMRTRITHIILN